MVEEGSIYKLMLEESSTHKLLIAFLLTDVSVHNCRGEAGGKWTWRVLRNCVGSML
jgi:hypothetical protein